MNIEKNYKDVYLRPQKCVVESRSQCDTSVTLGKRTFAMPVFPSNMKSVINLDTCIFLANKNWFYTMHRFGVDNVQFINEMQKNGLFSSISIGIHNENKEIEKLKLSKTVPDYITIDVANAWSNRVESTIKLVKDNLPNTFLIVGNVASKEAVDEITEWGADAIKVGVAAGHVCVTKNKTGFHRPMVTTILECSEVAQIPIIADGGIIEHGDIAKALSCGATMVMAGMIFSGYDESAGDIIEIEGKRFKEYFGSASEYNKIHRKNIEGRKILTDYKGSMNRLLQELTEDLQSSISYAGGNNLKAFHRGLLLEVK